MKKYSIEYKQRPGHAWLGLISMGRWLGVAFSEYAEDSEVLDRIRGNILDVETEQQKTNELLGQVLEELRKLNKALTPVQIPANYDMTSRSGYSWLGLIWGRQGGSGD